VELRSLYREPERRTDVTFGALEFHDVFRIFRSGPAETVALRGLDLRIEPGELVALFGPSGSGKSTALHLAAGLEEASAGDVVVFGRSLAWLGEAELAAYRAGDVALVFQSGNLWPSLSARENVLVGRLYGRDRHAAGDATAEADRLLSLVGLQGRGNVPATQLTLIDRKRLELARALATAPKLLLLDEFMAGLNPVETAEAMAVIRLLQTQGLSVLMVEHIVWALMDLCGRLIVLSAGEKIAEGTPAAVAADPAVLDAYLGGDVKAARRA